MPKIQFGFILPGDSLKRGNLSTLVEDLDRALQLITGHFNSIWMIDHLQSGRANILEGSTTLTYMAARHPGLRFGHTVLCQSFRNPALLAKMAATLQLLSAGRFILGLGAGWNEEEYVAYGYDFPSDAIRVEQLEETLQIIKLMWTEDRASFNGKHYRIVNASCEPKPDPVPPIMVGAFRPRMLRLTARHADCWNVSSTGLDGYSRMVEDFERACTQVGRDPSSVKRSWGGGCACASTQEQAESIAGSLYSPDNREDDFGFVGTPKQIIEQMRPFIELGVDTFMLDCGGFPNLDTLELLANEVLPALAEQA